MNANTDSHKHKESQDDDEEIPNPYKGFAILMNLY